MAFAREKIEGLDLTLTVESLAAGTTNSQRLGTDGNKTRDDASRAGAGDIKVKLILDFGDRTDFMRQ